MELKVYVVELASPWMTLLSQLESESHTSMAEGSPVELTHLLFQLGSVVETAMANWVVGLVEGLLFSAFVMVRVEAVGDDRVGAPGAFAEV